MAVNVVVRGKWKPVELEPSLFLQKDLNYLICMEELTDYNIVDKRNVKVRYKIFVFSFIAHTEKST